MVPDLPGCLAITVTPATVTDKENSSYVHKQVYCRTTFVSSVLADEVIGQISSTSVMLNIA